MTKRISQHYKDKKEIKVGRGVKFEPDIKEWTLACESYCYDKQIAKHFDISQETLYKFIDKQRYEKEQGNSSEFIDSYKKGKNLRRIESLELLRKVAREKEDIAAIIFSAKTFGGLIEAKDIKHIELKKHEMAFKSKQFLTELAKKFELNYEELSVFADKHFNDNKLDEI